MTRHVLRWRRCPAALSGTEVESPVHFGLPSTACASPPPATFTIASEATPACGGHFKRPDSPFSGFTLFPVNPTGYQPLNPKTGLKV